MEDGYDNTLLDLTFEYNNMHYLDMVMELHPAWKDLRKMMTESMSCPINDIRKEDRLERLEHNLQRGNYHIRDKILLVKLKSLFKM